MTDSLYKMIFLDIDGTLINKDKIISADTMNELTRAKEMLGIKLVVASSRMPKSMDVIAKELQTIEPLIAYNGALILGGYSSMAEREILSDHFINCEASAEIIGFASQHEVHMGIFWYNDWFVNDDGYWTQREIRNTKVEPVVCDLDLKIREWAKAGVGPHKIMLRGTEPELDAVEHYLKGSFSHLMVGHRIKDTILEIAPKHISKATAMAFLCERAGITNKEVVAFGDSYNDIDMLQWAGLGIAMGNAHATIKEAANAVTLSNDQDGIALAVRKYFP